MGKRARINQRKAARARQFFDLVTQRIVQRNPDGNFEIMSTRESHRMVDGSETIVILVRLFCIAGAVVEMRQIDFQRKDGQAFLVREVVLFSGSEPADLRLLAPGSNYEFYILNGVITPWITKQGLLATGPSAALMNRP